ncbi:MAG: hypothetical protein LAN37_06980 [Acidobacteriia bacterium]|nr:hypothetical protein [Terriglobia bacterium]
MSTPATLTTYVAPAADKERGHRMRVYAAAMASVVLLSALAFYGADYYVLGAADRPLSPKHALLKPSGRIGTKLGILGAGLFLLIFLYALRKRVPWLAKQGKSKHWLDYHVVAGLTAPVVIALHSSFKFHGIAGIAFWIMVAVAISGIIGRYIYAQIPRSLDSAEVSLKELGNEQEEMESELAGQRILAAADLQRVLRMPGPEEVRRMPLYRALLLVIALDLMRPFQIARLRRRALRWTGIALSLGGLLSTENPEVERVIETARRKSALSKRVAFLSRTQQVFHLWHVVHRPFSYSFAVLALIHIAVVLLLGYY